MLVKGGLVNIECWEVLTKWMATYIHQHHPLAWPWFTNKDIIAMIHLKVCQSLI